MLRAHREVSINVLKTKPGLGRAHFEIMRGSWEQSAVYCKKGGDFEEHGNAPVEHGGALKERKNRLTDAAQSIRDGKSSVQEIVENDPGLACRHGRNLMWLEGRVRAGRPRDPSKPPYVIHIKGEPGAGKTRCVYEVISRLGHPVDDAYWKGDGKWFDGYVGQFFLVMDDIRREWFHYEVLLKILYRYPIQVEVKGSSVHLTSYVIFMTSPYPWSSLVSMAEYENQLQRRIHKFVEYGVGDDYMVVASELEACIRTHCLEYSIDLPKRESEGNAESL